MVTIVDVILLNRCLAEDTSIAVDAQALANSDFYADGVINAQDSTALLMYLAGLPY